MKQKLRDLALVTAGAFIAALSLNIFFDANNIVPGGIGGLAISMQKLFGWSPGNFSLLINIPLLIVCYFFLGKGVFFKTLYGSWLYPIFIKLTENIPPITENQLLAAIYGGVMLGFGLGLVFRGNSSTGGTNIPSLLIHKYTPLSLGVSMTIIDGIIVATGLVAFDPDTVMYSIISLLIIGFVVETMMTGLQNSKNVMIISKKHETIKAFITQQIDRGVTELPILGGYTGQERQMLMTTLSSHELAKLQNKLQAVDATAFVIVMPAARVLGRGFSLTKNHPLSDDDFILPG